MNEHVSGNNENNSVQLKQQSYNKNTTNQLLPGSVLECCLYILNCFNGTRGTNLMYAVIAHALNMSKPTVSVV